MVKKTVSKTTNKKTVSSTQFLFSSYVEYLYIYIYIYIIVFASIKPWIPALFLLLARSGGPTLKAAQLTRRPLQNWVLKQHLKATLVAGSCMV